MTSDSTTHFYLDEQHAILTGDAARDALRRRNDAQFLSDGNGVIQVTKDRWRVAQRFESTFWMDLNPSAHDDRNHDHWRFFDGYSALRRATFGHAIELGCGPFTNLRLIASACGVRTCTLLDPLIESYLRHPHCLYADRRYLHTETNALSSILGRALPLRAVRRIIRHTVPGALRQRIPIARLLACPIEEMPLDRTFNLITLINVIEHCFDIHRVFDNIRRLAAPGAIFVFADRLYDHATVAEWVKGTRFDAGHPLLVDRQVIDRFLASTFTPLYRHVQRHEWTVDGFDLSHDAIYFIGSLKAGVGAA